MLSCIQNRSFWQQMSAALVLTFVLFLMNVPGAQAQDPQFNDPARCGTYSFPAYVDFSFYNFPGNISVSYESFLNGQSIEATQQATNSGSFNIPVVVSSASDTARVVVTYNGTVYDSGEWTGCDASSADGQPATPVVASGSASLTGVDQPVALGSTFDHVIQVDGTDISGTEFDFAYNTTCLTLNSVTLDSNLTGFNIDDEGTSVVVYANFVPPVATFPTGGTNMVLLNFTASTDHTACGATETVTLSNAVFTDNNGDEVSGTTTDGVITITNDPPVANDDVFNIGTETSLQSLDVLFNDTDPEGASLSIGSVTPGAGGTAVVYGTNINYTTNATTPLDTFTYIASDGVNNSSSATATVVYGAYGDCNFNGSTNVADIIRLIVEFFSNDTTQGDYLTVFAGSPSSSPNGCDANADGAIGSGDLVCMVNLIQGRPCGGTVMAASITSAAPSLSLTTPVVNENEGFDIALDYQDNSNNITAMLFALDYNTTYLSANGNVTFNLNDQYNGGAGTQEGRYTMSVFSMDKLVVPNGTLATIPMIATCGNRAAIDMGFGENPSPSLADVAGQEITPELSSSGVFVQCDDGGFIFIPIMVRD
ncbi:MAG: Ig-like domain-containing protein [Chloroflexota bacterium]